MRRFYVPSRRRARLFTAIVLVLIVLVLIVLVLIVLVLIVLVLIVLILIVLILIVLIFAIPILHDCCTPFHKLAPRRQFAQKSVFYTNTRNISDRQARPEQRKAER